MHMTVPETWHLVSFAARRWRVGLHAFLAAQRIDTEVQGALKGTTQAVQNGVESPVTKSPFMGPTICSALPFSILSRISDFISVAFSLSLSQLLVPFYLLFFDTSFLPPSLRRAAETFAQ
jgi:hypothetical protein